MKPINPKVEVCKRCKGSGLEKKPHDDLSCFDCNGMGEIYTEDNGWNYGKEINRWTDRCVYFW